MRKIYTSTRGLHLYFGLFISPFILIFSISILVLNHSDIVKKISPVKIMPASQTRLDYIPFDTTDLATAKAITKMTGTRGEVDFISKNNGIMTFLVNKPGSKTRIEVNTITKNVIIEPQSEGSLRGMSYLHIMPGPHNANIRGNSVYMKIWRRVSDGFVYLMLFLTSTGIFLWYFPGSERKAGIYALILGILLFSGILFLII